MGQQSLEINGFAGFTGRNSFSIDGGSALIENGQVFGGSVKYYFQPEFGAELFYSRQMTILSANSSIDNLLMREDGTVSYWMIGISPELMSSSDKFSYDMAFRLGGVTFATIAEGFDRSMNLATSLGGGIRYHLTDQLGVKLSANLFLPIFGPGATLWFGSGGVGAGATTWSPVLQLNANAGIFYRLNL